MDTPGQASHSIDVTHKDVSHPPVCEVVSPCCLHLRLLKLCCC